ncbi:hypothetical protein R3P38DRAFT_1315537 [Favolaschia claudopus]|uniref:DUF6534 domain-containing protein n=1 Tax=Favolaschia claudopus TaxID=2862362 RepID=A0AAW0AYG3_9AGAR
MSSDQPIEEVLVVAKFFLGPWLVGAFIDIGLMGVLSCQTVRYFSLYKSDGRCLCLAVAVLLLLNILKSAECFASVWIFVIARLGDTEFALRPDATGWWNTGNPLMVAFLSFYVQCYFSARLWVICKKWYIVAPILVVFVFSLVSMGIGTYFIATRQESRVIDWFAAHLTSAFVGDVVLSTTTAYFLTQTKKLSSSTEIAQIIRSLVHLTFQTAAPAAFVALLNLVFSQLYRTNNPHLAYIGIALNQILPKLYAVSMMHTLNVRRTILSRASGSWNHSTGGGVPKGDVEVGQIEGKETVEGIFVGVTEMFAPTYSVTESKLTASNPDYYIPSI